MPLLTIRRTALIFLLAAGLVFLAGMQRRQSGTRSGTQRQDDSARTVAPEETTAPAPPLPGTSPETLRRAAGGQPIPSTARGKEEAFSDTASMPGTIPPIIRKPESIAFPPPRNDEPRNIPKTITLCGDPRQKGPYTIRTRIPVGMRPTPHVHPDTRMCVVLSGQYYFGYGNTISPETTQLLGPGAFFTEPAGVPHFGWAKDETVVVQSSGYGPSGTRVVPEVAPPPVQP